MKILFLNSARAWGGNEKWMLMASEALKSEHEVCLAHRFPVIGQRFSVSKFRLPFIFEIDLFTIVPLIYIILRHRIDVLIPTKRKDYVLAGIVSRLCGRANILRLGIVRTLKSRWLQGWIYCDLADGIIVNAQRIQKTLQKSGYMKKQNIRVIYNGIDPAKLDQMAAHDIQKPSSFLITTMGSLIPRKRIDLVIQGFAQFVSQTKESDCQLVVIGDGESRESLSTLVQQLGLNERVVFIGHLDNPIPWLKISDLFVLASENEGISNAMLEAMFLKNAIIATQAGGVSEIIIHQKNGWLLDAAESAPLAEAIQILYQDVSLRQSIIEAGHHDVIKKMSLGRMGEEIAGFCREILAGRGTKY